MTLVRFGDKRSVDRIEIDSNVSSCKKHVNMGDLKQYTLQSQFLSESYFP